MKKIFFYSLFLFFITSKIEAKNIQKGKEVVFVNNIKFGVLSEENIKKDCLLKMENIFLDSMLKEELSLEDKFLLDNYCDCIFLRIEREVSIERYTEYIISLNLNQLFFGLEDIKEKMIDIGKQCFGIISDYMEINDKN